MRRILSSIFALSILPGSALFAQNIVGTWQGALKPNPTPELRIVMKIFALLTKVLRHTLQHRSESESD